jgi:alcohol dehydrogenase (cytochrome c)
MSSVEKISTQRRLIDQAILLTTARRKDTKYQSTRPMLAAVTTTSAELIFTGELTGDFLALDARDGRVLYRFNTGGPLNGGIITYAINGRQYVAVNSGNASGFWRAARGSATVLLFALPMK